MRVERTDPPAPHVGELPLHPRLTVVVGAAPGTVARLRAGFAALVDRDAPGSVDPVLELAPPRWHPSTGANRRPGTPPAVPSAGPLTGGPTTAGVPQPPGLSVADPGAAGRERAGRELERLEAQLRVAAGERMVLERRIVDVRVDLDPFAAASLDAARANLADLHRRRDDATERSAQVQHDRRRARSLRDELDRLDDEERRLAARDPRPVRLASDRLRTALASAPAADPRARDLAERLVAQAYDRQASEARAAAVGDLVERTAERLAEARSELDAARAGRPTGADAQVAEQLEAVRDRIFAAEERGGRRSRREVDDLRAQEAELLDRLGFETYTDYVMGGRSPQARAAAADRVELAQALVGLLEAELDRLRSLLPAGDGHDPRRPLVDQAAGLVGAPADALDRLTTEELVELLRRTPSPVAHEHLAGVASVADELRVALGAFGLPDTGSPQELLDRAQAWLDGDGDARGARRALAEERARLAEELDALVAGAGTQEPEEELEELDRAIGAARDRVADDEDRLVRHEQAVGRLADLRAEDLRLAEHEDDLRSRADEQRRALELLGGAAPGLPDDVSGTAGPADDEVVADVVSVEAGPVVFDTGVAAADRGRRVLERAAELRVAPGRGPVPLLVLGVDAHGADTAELLRRLERLSSVVQIVATTDDERVGTWAEALGPDVAAVVRP